MNDRQKSLAVTIGVSYTLGAFAANVRAQSPDHNSFISGASAAAVLTRSLTLSVYALRHQPESPAERFTGVITGWALNKYARKVRWPGPAGTAADLDVPAPLQEL